jgi:AcrR family transcriptional regulator
VSVVETRASRREELLDAADRVVLRDGVHSTMASLAAEAGITKPVLYRHFGDKGGLYRALAERHIEQLLVELRDALQQPGTSRGRVRHVVDTYLRLVEEQPQVYAFLLHRAALEDASVATEVASFLRRVGDLLADGIARELGLTAAASRTWGHAMVGGVQAAADWWLEERPVERSQVADDLTALLYDGYVSRVDR